MKFENCPFEPIFQAFRALWPDLPIECHWVASADLQGAKGSCSWDELGTAHVCVSMNLPVAGACDILCHELAHAAVSRGEPSHGPDYHSPIWELAYHTLVAKHHEILGPEVQWEIITDIIDDEAEVPREVWMPRHPDQCEGPDDCDAHHPCQTHASEARLGTWEESDLELMDAEESKQR